MGFEGSSGWHGSTPPPPLTGFVPYVGATANVDLGAFSLTSPTIYGSGLASGTLTLQSTSNATKGKILFGTSAYDEVNNRLGIGTTSPAFDFDLIKSVPASYVGANVQNTSATGYSFIEVLGDNNTTYASLNVFNTAGGVGTFYDNNTAGVATNSPTLSFLTNESATGGWVLTAGGYGTGSEKARFTINATSFRQAAATSGAITQFTFTNAVNTNQTASTNIPNFRVNGSSKQWLTGTVANQYWNYLTANTAAFVGASTMTNSFGLFVEAATAGTNATITNNYAAGFSGRVGQYGLGNSTYFGDLCGVKDDIANRQNTAFGAQAANKVASGGLNIAMGYQSLFTNVSGNNNVAIGGFTLLQATSNSNIAVGGYALYNLTTGQSNVALGYDTGGGVTIGANNVFIGNGITGLPSSLSNNIILATNLGVERFRYNPSQGSASLFSFSPASTTANVASTEINIFRVNTATTTILTGALTTQRFTYLPSQTLAFAAASTATNVYGLFVNAPTAGTNATITNNYGIGTDSAYVAGRLVVGVQLATSPYGNSIVVVPNTVEGIVVNRRNSVTACLSLGSDASSNATLNVTNADYIFNISAVEKLRLSSTNLLTFADTINIAFNTTTGSKIMTSNLQKGAFWGATPIVQPTTAVAAATLVSNAGTALTSTDTFDGYTIQQFMRAVRNTGLLA